MAEQNQPDPEGVGDEDVAGEVVVGSEAEGVVVVVAEDL